MFTLVVKNPSGQVYVTETFETKEALDKWLAVEQSRPYWQKDFQVEIIDKTAEAQAQQAAEAASRQARAAGALARATLLQEISTLAQKKNRTLIETNDLVDKIASLVIKI